MEKASWLTRTLVRFYTRRVWSFDLRFKLWFSDVRAFQKILRRCGAVVSGSLALQFFHRVHYPDSDMDLYVHHSGINVVTDWIESQGYVLTSGSAQPEVSPASRVQDRSMEEYQVKNTTIAVIVNCDKREVHWDGTIRIRRIQVIGLNVPPVQHILHEYHSTGVVNFISATIAVSLFPRSTFIERKFALLHDTDAMRGDWMERYRNRGFDVVEDGTFLASFKEMSTSERYTLDASSWKIRFQVPEALEKRRREEERRLCIGFRIAKVRRYQPGGSDEVQILRLYEPLDNSVMALDDCVTSLHQTFWYPIDLKEYFDVV